jgi:hypothetical protein
VQRLTMQKRIFHLDGQPFMATYDGAYWETHGTLLRLIEEHARDEPQRSSEALGGPPQPEQAPLDATAPAPPARKAAESPSPNANSPEGSVRHPARTTRRRRANAEVAPHRDHDVAAGGSTETAGVEQAVADAPVVTEASGDGPVGTGDQSGSAVRRSRIRQPQAPRWATAGKERRGRLK